jgi:glycosyltransferase involved in cell wall biosynthesis
VEFPNWEGLGLVYAWDRPTPVVVRLHTSSLETQLIDQVPSTYRTRWDVRRERLLARAADVLVTHSAAHRERMAEELCVRVDRIRVIPHGIPPADGGRRGNLAVPAVVFVGRMEKRKGTLDLLRAAPRVLEEFPDTHFVFIGSDRPHCPGGRTHAEYVRDELPGSVRRRILLLGRLPDEEVERWRRRATVFAAPSVYESFGLVFLEAMRWGVPVIGTRAGGIPEVVEDGRTGLLVAPGQPGELAEAILRLLRSPTLRAELGEAGRAVATGRFGIAQAAERIEQLYQQTVNTCTPARARSFAGVHPCPLSASSPS